MLPNKAKVMEKWRNDALGHSTWCRSERSEWINPCSVFNVSDQPQNERKGEIICIVPMPWVKTELRLSQKGWYRVRTRMGCSKPSQLGLLPSTKLKDQSWTKHRFISNLTLLFITTWIKIATTECSQDWMPVVLSSVQTRAARTELRPWEMQIKLGACALHAQLQHHWRQ